MDHATKPTWQQGNQITNLILAMDLPSDAIQAFIGKGGVLQDLMSLCLFEQLLQITGKEEVEQFRLNLSRYLFQGVHKEISAVTRLMGKELGFRAPATLPLIPFTLKQIAQYVIAAGDVRVLHYIPAGYTFNMASSDLKIFFNERDERISEAAMNEITTSVTEGRFVLWSLNNQLPFSFSDMAIPGHLTKYGHALGYLRARIPSAIDLLYLLHVKRFTNNAGWRYYWQCDPGTTYNNNYFAVATKTHSVAASRVFMQTLTTLNKPNIYFSSRPTSDDEQTPRFYITPIATEI